jgi:hypothetical protein
LLCAILARSVRIYKKKAEYYEPHYHYICEQLQEQKQKSAWYKQNAITDEDNQIEAVSEYDDFVCMKIFNKEETKVFYLVKDILKRPEFNNWHVHGQVCLGQIIKTDRSDNGDYHADRAHKSINSKRADMVVTDNFGFPVAIIEYFGTGHWGTDKAKTAKRDEVKRIVAEKAGINLIELLPDYEMDEEHKYGLIISAFLKHLSMRNQTIPF